MFETLGHLISLSKWNENRLRPFKEDTYDGKGKLYNENGNYYEGEFTKGKKNGDGKEYDNKGNIVGEDEYKNNEPVSIANLEDTVMRVLSFGNEFLKSIGLSPNYTCENCGCSTDDHYLIEKNIWECKKCKEKCVNVLMENLKWDISFDITLWWLFV